MEIQVVIQIHMFNRNHLTKLYSEMIRHMPRNQMLLGISCGRFKCLGIKIQQHHFCYVFVNLKGS